MTRSGSGNQYDSVQTPRPIVAPRLRSHQFRAGVPPAHEQNQPAATTSTKVSANSPRHTVECHNGRLAGSSRPTTSHFAAVASAAAAIPPATSAGPATSTAHGHPHRAATATTATAHEAASNPFEATATMRVSSKQARATRSPHGGAYVRCWSMSSTVRRRWVGGLPSHDVPFFASARRGAADSTATNPRLGTLRPGAVIPEFPTNACLPIRTGSIRIHPPPSSYMPSIVSSARNAPSRTVVIDGRSNTVDASTSGPMRAPSALSQTGVNRLE